MIEEVYKVADPLDSSTVNKALQDLAGKAAGFSYAKKEPTAKTVPFGSVVVFDDGSTKRLYIRTGEDRVGYITLS